MALPPLLVEIAPGTSTRVKAGLRDTIVFVVPDGTEGSWQATVADPGVAEFVAGGDQGTWIARPSVTPVAPGTTSVTLDGPGGTAEVTVEVVAADHAG